MMYVTGGAGHTAVLPEIYYASQARQWAELAYIAHRRFHRRVHFAGVMTQGRRCSPLRLPPARRASRARPRAREAGDAGETRVPQGGTNIVSESS